MSCGATARCSVCSPRSGRRLLCTFVLRAYVTNTKPREGRGMSKVMRAVRSGVIRQEDGRPRLMIREGETTAHADHPVVRDHPHLWAEMNVDFPSEDMVSAAADDVNLSHTQALRDLLTGLAERGYQLPDPDSVAPDDVPDMVVRMVLNNLPPCPAPVNEDDAPAFGRAQVPARADQDLPAGDEQDEQDEQGADETDQGPEVDPETKEGRQAIREWAEAHGYEVHTSGPLPQAVLDAWREDQG